MTPLGIYLFLYLGMGAVFAVGLLYAWRQGDVGLRRKQARINLLGLVGGLLVYALLHGIFQFVLVEV